MPERGLAEVAAAENPQLSFAIDTVVNQVTTRNTIFTNAAADYQTIVLTITTNADNTVFSPGTLVPPSQAPSGPGSVLYLDLTNLNLSPTEFSAIQASADGWSFAKYAGAMAVGMTPATNPVTLNSGPGNSIEVRITGLAITTPPMGGSAQLDVTYYQVSPTPAGDIGIACYFKVLLQRAPDAKSGDLSREITLGIDNQYVIGSVQGSTVANKLLLTLGRGPDGKTVTAGPKTAFTLTFVYAPAPGYGALTDKEHAAAIAVTAGPNATGWHITPGSDLQNPSWLLKPPAGKPIIGTGAQANVGFTLGNIVTLLRPGPTTLLLSYSGVPGYQDGSFAITLYKVAHVVINSLTCSPSPAYLDDDGLAEITVSWATQDATALALRPLSQPDVTGKTSITTKIPYSTTFTLQASGPQADRDNVAFLSQEAMVLPRINSFAASPSEIYAKDFPAAVEFRWAVATNEKVALTSSLHGGSDVLSPRDTITKTLNQPQMMTLSPVTGTGQPEPGPTRNLVISAFTTKSHNYTMSQAPVHVAASPAAPIIAVAGQNQVWFVDSVLYQPVGSAISTGTAPRIAFAPDGSFVVVASGSGALSLIQVTTTNVPPYYAFSAVDLPAVSGQPAAVAISADGTQIFVAVAGAGSAGSLVVLTKSGSTYAVSATLAVGKQPGGIALDPSGARVFVSNTADASVSVIGKNVHGAYSVVLTLTGLGAGPTGLAVTPDGAILLVACGGADVVQALNTRYPGTTVPQSLAIGNPDQIAMMPGGRYAFVTRRNASAVALVGCGDLPSNCSVLEQSIAVGSQPTGVSVTGDNGLALVACQGGGVLSVVTLAAYAEQTQPVDTGGLPTDVTAAADGSLVFAWHNAQRHVFGPSQPALGLFVYTTASGAVSQVLNDQKVVGFVCAPDPALHTGYAVMLGQNVLTIVDTRSFDTKSVPLADPGATRYPDALAISGDGSRLFVVTDDGALHYSMSIFDVSRATPSKLTEIALFTASGLGFLGICAAPDGSQAFVSDSITGNLYVVQQSGRGYAAKPQPIPITGSPMALAILPDGSKVYVLSSTTADRMIAVVDTQSLSVRTMSYGQAFASVSLVGITASPDGQRLFATDMASMAIRVIDPVSLRFIQQIGWSSSVLAPYGIAILPDGSRIFTANVMSNNIAIVQQVQPA